MLLSWIHRNRPAKTAEPPDTHDKGHLAQSGESLAKQKPFPDTLRKIRDLSGLPQVHFNQFYHAPLLRFLALTQFADAHVLHTHLLAVIDALKLRRSLILPTNSDAESINATKDLWTYAVFVGALMYRSPLLMNQQVLLLDRDNDKHWLKWNPFDGSPKPHSSVQVLGDLALAPQTSPVFIPLIFDASCLSWLYRDPDVFNEAIAMASNPKSDERLGQLIVSCHSQTEITPPSDSLEKLVVESNAEAEPPIEHVEDQALSESTGDIRSFCQWLVSSIQNPELTDHVCETLDGYALSDPAIFQHYAKQHRCDDWKLIQKAFMALDIYYLSEHRVAFKRNATCRALIIKDLTSLDF